MRNPDRYFIGKKTFVLHHKHDKWLPLQDSHDDYLPYDFPVLLGLYWLMEGEQLKGNRCNIHAQEK